MVHILPVNVVVDRTRQIVVSLRRQFVIFATEWDTKAVGYKRKGFPKVWPTEEGPGLHAARSEVNAQSHEDSVSNENPSEFYLVTEVTPKDLEVEEYGMYGVYKKGTKSPYKVTVKVEDKCIEMEIDTGVARSTVSEQIYCDHMSKYPLVACNLTMHSYAVSIIPNMVTGIHGVG